MSKALRATLLSFRNKLDGQLRARRQERVERIRNDDGKAPQGSLRNFQLAADVQALMHDIRAAAQRDLSVYAPRNVMAPAVGTTDAAPMPAPVTGHFALAIRQQLAPVLQAPAVEDSPIAHFSRLIETEVAAIGEGAMQGRMSGAFVPKLKTAQQAFSNQRYGDVATILKSALRNEPHNNVLLFIKSQFLYFMGAHGQPDALPEARDLAQKAMIPNDKLPPGRLAHYRYQSVVSEAPHDAGRALGWMREHNMLQVTAMQQGGLAAMGGLPLKLWAILSTFDASLWGEVEFKAMRNLALHVVGGATLYMGLLRNPLTDAAMSRKDPMPLVEETERIIAEAYAHYLNIAPAMERLPAQQLARGGNAPLWLVRTRYMSLLTAAAPRPTFDQVLLNVGISGESFRPGGYPENEVMAALGDPNIHYWRLWGLSITPAKELRQTQFLPAAETLEDGDLLGECDALLTLLQQAEQAHIKTAVWNDIKPWMIRWQLDHLLAAGTGSNHPRERFAPAGGPLSLCYRQWSQPTAQGILASEIILQTAKVGAFADITEVLAAFEGAYRLLDDPVHGLVATQKRALKAAKDQNPQRFGNMHIDDGAISGAQLMAILLPLLLMGGIGAIVVTSRNMGQAIGLSLALAGFVGVAMIGMSSKKS